MPFYPKCGTRNRPLIFSVVTVFNSGSCPGGIYIFSSANSINPATKLENFLIMRKILGKYGKYPINMNH